jgi:hypothetical protein
MKFGLKHYYQPTPRNFRKLGDALLAVCLFAQPYPLVNNNHALSLCILGMGIAGKFLTNFFAEDGESARNHNNDNSP